MNQINQLFSSVNSAGNWKTFGALNANNNVSSLFSSLSSGKSATGGLFNGINVSDYASIKNGSYYKVLRNYYNSDESKSVDAKTALEAYEKKNKLITDSSSSLSTTINDLKDMSYTEENRDDLVSKVENFVKEYNSMIDSAAESDNKFILQKAAWLTNLTKEYDSSLSDVGIDIGKSNKLSINSEDLKNADLNALKSVFGANVSSYSNKVLYKAEQIYSLSKTYGTSATAYTSSGAYNRTYTTENSFDTLL